MKRILLGLPAALGTVFIYVLLLFGIGWLLFKQNPDALVSLAQTALQGAGISFEAATLEIFHSPLRIRGQNLVVDVDGAEQGRIQAQAAEVQFNPLWGGDEHQHLIHHLHIQGLQGQVSLQGGEDEQQRAGLHQLLGNIPAQEILVRSSSLDLEMPGWQGALSEAHLQYRSGENSLQFRSEATFKGPEGSRLKGHLLLDATQFENHLEVRVQADRSGFALFGVQGNGTARAHFTVFPQGVRIFSAEAVVHDPRMTLQEEVFELPGPVRVSLTDGDKPNPPSKLQLQATIPDHVSLQGTMNGFWKSWKNRILGEGRLQQVGDLLSMFSPLFPQEFRSLRMEGPLPFRFRWSEQSLLSLTLLPQKLEVALPALEFKTLLSGNIIIPDVLAQESSASAELELGSLEWTENPVAIQKTRGKVVLAGSFQDIALQEVSLAIPPGGVLYQSTPLEVGRVALRGTGRWTEGQLNFRDMTISSSELGRIEGVLQTGAGTKLEILSSEINLGQLLHLHPVSMLPGWSISGTVGVQGVWHMQGSQIKTSLQAGVSELNFSSPPGDILAQNGSIALSLRTEPSGIKVTVRGDSGELLIGTRYFNLGTHPVQSRIHFKPESMERFSQIGAHLEWQGYGNLSLRGAGLEKTDTGWAYNGHVKAEKLRLGQLFSSLVLDPYSVSVPELGGVQLQGTGNVELRFKGNGGGPKVDGRMLIQGAGVVVQDGLEVEGISLDMPVAYDFGQQGRIEADPAEMGGLHIERFATPFGVYGPLDFPVALVANRFVLNGTMRLPLYEGGVSLSGLQVFDPLSKDPVASTKVQVERIELDQLTVGDIPLQGYVRGDLGTVTLTPRTLTTEGGLTGLLYGAEMELSHLVVQQPFESSRIYGADLGLRRMHLEPFSRAVGIGRITGRLNVALDDLRVAYGQPVGFSLRAWSEETKGVDQKVSLTAVNAISVLGTGSSLTSTALNLFKPFVDEFPYEKIGFFCDLENDIFRVRGLIQEGGVEYLVKKPLFFGINVINRNPDNRIRFQDMLERLNRILEPGDAE